MTAAQSLELIGQDPQARAAVVAMLRDYERRSAGGSRDVRAEVVGPIMDALFAKAGPVRKELSSGLVFEFLYRSQIARDFILSDPERPDHVWEPQTTRLLLHLSRQVSDAVIGGAYFGDQAVIVAGALRGRGVCHAFEPDADQAAMLAANARLNGLDNIRISTLGLWSTPDVRLSFGGADALAAPVVSEKGVPVTTIDAYAAEAGIAPGLIMLDVEGGELAILQGAEQVLRRHAPHLIFEVHRLYVDWSQGLRQTPIVRFLESLGYTLFAIRDIQSNLDLSSRPIELVPPQTAYLEGPPHGFNMVAVRDAAVLEGDLFRLAPGVSPKLLRHRDPRLHHPLGGLP